MEYTITLHLDLKHFQNGKKIFILLHTKWVKFNMCEFGPVIQTGIQTPYIVYAKVHRTIYLLKLWLYFYGVTCKRRLMRLISLGVPDDPPFKILIPSSSQVENLQWRSSKRNLGPLTGVKDNQTQFWALCYIFHSLRGTLTKGVT